MKKVLTTHVGADGVLALTVPLGETGANKPVRVTVETLEGPAADCESWRRFVTRMAGAISDPTFARPPQGDYEVRDELP